MLIFPVVRISFQKEINRVKRHFVLKTLNHAIEWSLGKRLKHYLMWIFAGILIASPWLPDEAGMTVLSGLTKIKPLTLAILCFVLNTLGIFILLVAPL
ncbi:MAG: hypothetical protein AABW59_01225 [archaeon]